MASVGVEISSRKELADWIKGQSRHVALVIAARAAMRFLPTEWAEERKTLALPSPDWYFENLLLAYFRACDLAWVASVYPSHMSRLQRIGRSHVGSFFQYLSDDRFNGGADYTHEEYIAARSRSSMASMLRCLTSPTSREAKEAAESAAFSSVLAEDTNLSTDIIRDRLKPILADAIAMSLPNTRDRKALTLACAISPLWQHGPPSGLRRYWEGLRQFLLARDPTWSVWVEWYEARLLGSVPNAAYDVSRVTAIEWKNDYKSTNKAIRELLTRQSGPDRSLKDRVADAVQQVEGTLDELASHPAMMGHNNPPSPMDEVAFLRTILPQIQALLTEIHQQLDAPSPRPEDLTQTSGTLHSSVGILVKWLAERTNVATDGFAKRLGERAADFLIAGTLLTLAVSLSGRLQELATAFVAWISHFQIMR